MDGLSTLVAGAQLIDTCITYGNKLIQLIRAYREANDRVAELILRVRGIWIKTERQITILRSLWDALDPLLQEHQGEVLKRLRTKLAAAIEGIATYSNEGEDESNARGGGLDLRMSRIGKLRFAGFEKSLKGTVNDLESWHNCFDPSWYLMTLNTNADMDKRLALQAPYQESSLDALKNVRGALNEAEKGSNGTPSVMLSSDFLDDDSTTVAGSTSVLRQVRGHGQLVIVDRTNHRPADAMHAQTVQSYICSLAKLLTKCDPETIGLLNCMGIIKADAHFEILFAIPPRLKDPVSLRSLLASSPPPLDVRFSMAHDLARAVMSCHSARLVHKNIRPETLLVFNSSSSSTSEHSFGAAFLVGFEQFRPVEGHSSLVSDMRWERNIYRHPRRQGARPEELYTMQHDIYSLGVCLLEIGLWSSFVVGGSDGECGGGGDATAVLPGHCLDIAEQLAMRNTQQAARQIKDKLCKMAETLLPSQMGSAYSLIVRSCLTCLDRGEDNLFSGDQELEDENGITIGVAYIEKILVKLESIAMVPVRRQTTGASS